MPNAFRSVFIGAFGQTTVDKPIHRKLSLKHRRAIARQERENNTMPSLKEIVINKKIKTLTGETVEKKGKISFPIPESLEEAQEMFGDNLWKWARHGQIAQIRIAGGAAIAGTDSKLKGLRRQFTQAYESFVKLAGMKPADALAILTVGPNATVFAPLMAEMEAMKATGDVSVVYSKETLPLPRWFTGDDEDDDEEVAEETAVATV